MKTLTISALVLILGTLSVHAQTFEKQETLQKIVPETKSIESKIIKIKPLVQKKTAAKEAHMESAGMQKLSSAVQVKIGRGWGTPQKPKIPNGDYARLCHKLNIFAKKADGEMHKLTAEYQSTKPAFGLPASSWCQTEKISVPANEDIHFVATVIDDIYKVTPATQAISFKPNEPQPVHLTLKKK